MAFYAERCQTCFHCEAACSDDAIRRESTKRIDFSKCTHCGDCAKVCPHEAIRRIGVKWNIDDLLAELLKDKDFYEESGGGVTLTGGEPMYQFPFLQALLPRIKEAGIHVNMETCGVFNWTRLESLLPYLDLIYFDLKHIDSEVHEQITGVDNRSILENFTKLVEVFPAVQARMPIIPGKNDDPGNINATAHFLKSNGHNSIHCLPYHRLGEAKIPRIDTSLKPLDIGLLSAVQIEYIKTAFGERGVYATIYD